MHTPTPAPRFKRYYGDDGKASRDVDKTPFVALLHAAYTHWVRNHCHLRDFEAAVDHVACVALATYLLDGQPRLTGAAPDTPNMKLAVQPKTRPVGPQLRLYDEINALAPEVDLSPLEQAVHYGFVKWLGDGFHPRDFNQFATDCAKVLVYDHTLVQQLQGLGGGRSEEQFLSEPYRG